MPLWCLKLHNKGCFAVIIGYASNPMTDFSNRYLFRRGKRVQLRECGVVMMLANRRTTETSEPERLNKRLRSLASQLSLAEKNERRRIAVELHDRTNETLIYSIIKLKTLAESVLDSALVESLDEVGQLLQQLVQETRLLIFELSPPSLYYLGLEAAVKALTERIADIYGLPVSSNDDKQSKSLEADVRVLLFQSVRELLTNVIKHSRCRTVSVNV